MYKGWTIERWQTPVSDAKSLVMVLLVDDGELSVILQDAGAPRRRRYRFIFSNPIAYRNILEEYRTELWKKLEGQHKELGWTLQVLDSPWIQTLRKEEPLIDIKVSELSHYMICTEDDVVEILSAPVPVIVEIEPGTTTEIVGKSTVYYNPEDREAIERLFSAVRISSRSGKPEAE